MMTTFSVLGEMGLRGMRTINENSARNYILIFKSMGISSVYLQLINDPTIYGIILSKSCK